MLVDRIMVDHVFLCSFSIFKKFGEDFPDGPVVKTLPSSAGSIGLIPDRELDPTSYNYEFSCCNSAT